MVRVRLGLCLVVTIPYLYSSKHGSDKLLTDSKVAPKTTDNKKACKIAQRAKN